MAYYEAAFADGRLRVAGGFVGLHDPLCNGMTIHHYLHRHEPPVLDIAIPVSSTSSHRHCKFIPLSSLEPKVTLQRQMIFAGKILLKPFLLSRQSTEARGQ